MFLVHDAERKCKTRSSKHVCSLFYVLFRQNFRQMQHAVARVETDTQAQTGCFGISKLPPFTDISLREKMN